MDEATLGARIRQFRESIKMSQRDLGRLANIEQASISRIERGDTILLSPSAGRIARVFDIPLGELLGLNGTESTVPLGTRSVPVLTAAEASKWDGTLPESEETRTFVLTALSHSALTFATLHHGQAMVPEFQPEHLLVVDPKVIPLPGDFVLARRGGPGAKVSFRQFRSLSVEADSAFELVPLNRLYPSLQSNHHHVELIGTMVEHRRFRKPNSECIHCDD